MYPEPTMVATEPNMPPKVRDATRESSLLERVIFAAHVWWVIAPNKLQKRDDVHPITRANGRRIKQPVRRPATAANIEYESSVGVLWYA